MTLALSAFVAVHSGCWSVIVVAGLDVLEALQSNIVDEEEGTPAHSNTLMVVLHDVACFFHT